MLKDKEEAALTGRIDPENARRGSGCNCLCTRLKCPGLI
jgi:hypothetical protein